MNNECENRLKERFKFIKCGTSCGDGWFPLINSLCEKLEALNFNNSVIQISEKWGMLRFSVNGATGQQYSLIEDYESKSDKYCETCGGPGELKQNENGWYKTLCQQCRDKEDK